MAHMPNTDATQVHGEGYKILSWNVRGLGHIIDRAKVSALLKSLVADIVFLQETHIENNSRARV